jgi:ATPase subunit of ABC transporter with duplicated ATPase domains
LITGEIEADRGQIVRSTDLVISQLRQNLPEAIDLRVRDIVRSGLAETELLLEKYQQQSNLELDREGMRELATLHARIDAHDGWHIATISISRPSSGWRTAFTLGQARCYLSRTTGSSCNDWLHEFSKLIVAN